MTTDRVAELDEALNALADVSVALTSIYPVMRMASVPQEVLAFVEDGMDAASRARRLLTALRETLDNGPNLQSVRMEP